MSHSYGGLVSFLCHVKFFERKCWTQTRKCLNGRRRETNGNLFMEKRVLESKEGLDKYLWFRFLLCSATSDRREREKWVVPLWRRQHISTFLGRKNRLVNHYPEREKELEVESFVMMTKKCYKWSEKRQNCFHNLQGTKSTCFFLSTQCFLWVQVLSWVHNKDSQGNY